MKLKNGEIQQALSALHFMSQEKLPVKGALKIRKLTRTLGVAMEVVEEVRKKLLEEHAARDEQGNIVPGETLPDGQTTTKLDEAKKMDFYKAYQELMAQDSEIDDKLRLTVEDLSNKEVSPALLIQLGDLLTDEPIV